jgi:tetratricopeptide (TPR) repeat protein
MTKKIYLRFVISFIVLFLWGPVLSKGFAEKNDIALADANYDRAVLLMDSNPSLAMNELNSAKKLNPNDPKIFVAIGQIYFRKNDYREAIETFKKALELDKNYVVAYSNLGYTYMALKDWNNAIQSFRMILNYPNITAPHYVYNAIGWAYYEKNEFKKSIEELKKAVKLKKNYAVAHYNLGLSLLGLENFDHAFVEFKNAVKFQPELVQAHNQLALIFLKKNKKEEARKEFQKVMELAPDSLLAEEAKNYLNIIDG